MYSVANHACRVIMNGFYLLLRTDPIIRVVWISMVALIALKMPIDQTLGLRALIPDPKEASLTNAQWPLLLLEFRTHETPSVISIYDGL